MENGSQQTPAPEPEPVRTPPSAVLPFDFRRPDRIPKSQVRAIHLLHDTFVRNLASSLSAYLRCYLSVNLVHVGQLSYAEFLQALPSPTCVVSLGLQPYEGSGILELNPSVVFPIVEMLLGGNGRASPSLQRDLTEIEQKLLDGVIRIILQDLREAWKSVSAVEFTADAIETEPQLLQRLAPNEAVVAIRVEFHIGEAVGAMNIAMPSIVIKMMRQKFDQQWSMRKTQASHIEQARLLAMLRESRFTLEALLPGLDISVRDLLALAEGHVLLFNHPAGCPVELLVNGSGKYIGQIVTTGRKRAFLVDRVREPVPAAQGKTSEEEAELPAPVGAL